MEFEILQRQHKIREYDELISLGKQFYKITKHVKENPMKFSYPNLGAEKFLLGLNAILWGRLNVTRVDLFKKESISSRQNEKVKDFLTKYFTPKAYRVCHEFPHLYTGFKTSKARHGVKRESPNKHNTKTESKPRQLSADLLCPKCKNLVIPFSKGVYVCNGCKKIFKTKIVFEEINLS